MERHIKYSTAKTKSTMGVYFGYQATRKDIENSILKLIKDGGTNIQVVKTRLTKCTCSRCGNFHQKSSDSIDTTYDNFIKDNGVKPHGTD